MHLTYIDQLNSKSSPKCSILITYIPKIYLSNYSMKLKFRITGKMRNNLPKKVYTCARKNDDQMSRISQKI